MKLSPHKWVVVRTSILHGETILSRHKTEFAAQESLRATHGGRFDAPASVRRLSKLERANGGL